MLQGTPSTDCNCHRFESNAATIFESESSASQVSSQSRTRDDVINRSVNVTGSEAKPGTGLKSSHERPHALDLVESRPLRYGSVFGSRKRH